MLRHPVTILKSAKRLRRKQTIVEDWISVNLMLLVHFNDEMKVVHVFVSYLFPQTSTFDPGDEKACLSL